MLTEIAYYGHLFSNFHICREGDYHAYILPLGASRILDYGFHVQHLSLYWLAILVKKEINNYDSHNKVVFISQQEVVIV